MQVAKRRIQPVWSSPSRRYFVNPHWEMSTQIQPPTFASPILQAIIDLAAYSDRFLCPPINNGRSVWFSSDSAAKSAKLAKLRDAAAQHALAVAVVARHLPALTLGSPLDRSKEIRNGLILSEAWGALYRIALFGVLGGVDICRRIPSATPRLPWPSAGRTRPPPGPKHGVASRGRVDAVKLVVCCGYIHR